MAREERKASNRPPKRKLVRWNDDLDELLLLTIQSISNKEGIKLPWAEVAKSMGGNITEGAIIQHLAKLRVRRVEKNKAVPPPLRRGGTYSGTIKTVEGPVTPQSPKEKSDPVKRRNNDQLSQPESPVQKRAASKVIDPSSDSDEEWTSQKPKNKKSKQKRTQKKRKTTPVEPEPPLDHVDSDEEAPVESPEPSQSSNELLAVGADFLEFLGGEKEVEEQASAASRIEDEDQVETQKSLIVTLKLGTNNIRRLRYKGIGVFQDRDPEKRWELPPPGPDGQTWGFSRDYYGPIPQSAQHSHNPGLLRGDWPREVALRQYEAPQAVTWSNETYHPDPRLVHPAIFLEDPNCEPSLRLHRKLRTAEETNPEARALDQGSLEYRTYVATHRELPKYRASSWMTSATQPTQHLALHDSGNGMDSHAAHSQAEPRMETGQSLDSESPVATNNDLVDDELLPVIENDPGNPTARLSENGPDSETDPFAFDTDFESFLNPFDIGDMSDFF